MYIIIEFGWRVWPILIKQERGHPHPNYRCFIGCFCIIVLVISRIAINKYGVSNNGNLVRVGWGCCSKIITYVDLEKVAGGFQEEELLGRCQKIVAVKRQDKLLAQRKIELLNEKMGQPGMTCLINGRNKNTNE
jgi:hypothetical protein